MRIQIASCVGSMVLALSLSVIAAPHSEFGATKRF